MVDIEVEVEEEAEDGEPPDRLVYSRMGGDETPDVIFVGQGKDTWRDAYHVLLTIPLVALVGVLAAAFVLINLVFALLYMAVGGIGGTRPDDFLNLFFFSVQTLSTIGYGQMAPTSVAANCVVSLEAFVGLFDLAITTGLVFARISRPTARVMFSDRAVVTDFEGCPTFMFRAANRRRNRIVEAEVSLTLVRNIVTSEGHTIRRFDTLPTVRSRSPIFYLTWQIMHRIDDASPLSGESQRSLMKGRAEIVAVLKGTDETFVQTIHARASYTPDEIVWGRRLVDIISEAPDGRRVVDYTHFHDIE